MDMSLFVLLLLSGLLSSASGLLREYHYINTIMSWSEAQSYCRARFTDLATVESVDDVNMMINTVNDGYSGSVWIGLKRPTQGSWVWSMGHETLTQYSPWWGATPSGTGECVCSVNSYWYDIACASDYDFVCYNDATSGYILITYRKNWRDAQSFCRQYYTDLATISSSVEQNLINSVAGASRWVWIGLSSSGSWQWSDQWSLNFTNWAAGQPSASGDCVAMSTTDSGLWAQNSCDVQGPFICYEEAKFVKKQTVRFYLTHDGEYSMNDSLQTAILNKISEKLKSMGLKGYESISWRKDGKVFHLSKRTVNTDATCDKYFK